MGGKNVCWWLFGEGTLVLTGRFIEKCQILVLGTNNEEKLIGVKGYCRQIWSICDVSSAACDYASIQLKLTIMQTCVYVSNSCNAAESQNSSVSGSPGGGGGGLTVRLLIPWHNTCHTGISARSVEFHNLNDVNTGHKKGGDLCKEIYSRGASSIFNLKRGTRMHFKWCQMWGWGRPPASSPSLYIFSTNTNAHLVEES